MKLVAGLLSLILASNFVVDAAGPQRPGGHTNLQELNGAGDIFNRVGVDFISKDDVGYLEGLALLFGASQGDVDSIISLIKLGLGLVDFVDKIFDKVFNGSSIEVDISLPGSKDKEILAMFEVLSYRLEQLQLGIQGIESSLREMMHGLPHVIRWEVMLDSLEDYTKPINSLYQRFALYQTRRDDVEQFTLKNFAESVVSHEVDSIMNLMASVHSMVVPDAPPLPGVLQQSMLNKVGPEYRTITLQVNEHYNLRYKENLQHHPEERGENSEIGEFSLRPSVFEVLEEVLQKYDDCSRKQTAQQMMMGLYSMVSLTQARGYAMINFAYMLLRIYDIGNFTVEQEVSKNLFEYYSRTTLNKAMEVIKRAPNVFWKCDPAKHVQGETYVMFTELLQGHIENEVDMNDRGTCIKKCKDYEHARVFGCYKPAEQVCGRRKKCQGTLHSCKFINADADVCFSSNPYRRYDWIKYENGHTLGDTSKKCEDKEKVDSWWRWFVHCSYCVCLCDDPTSKTTDRYVSLLPAISNLNDSMVLTGIKFSKRKRVIVMEIQQGRTMPQGQVDPSSLTWVSPPEIDVDNPFFKSGSDYQILTYEARKIDLDLLKAPTDHVITGTRFRTLGTHLNLEIRVTPVNFTTGKLNSDLSYWMSNDNTPLAPTSPRTELKLRNFGDPARTTAPSAVDSKPDMFLAFEATSWDQDAAQLTIPYFDSIPVTTSPPTWITGLDLHHKSNSVSGGFVSLRMHCNNATKYFDRLLADIPAS